MVLEKNVFVERILPASILRKLEPEEMEAYRARFRDPGEGRRPTLTWPRQIPIAGEPPGMVAAARASAAFLAAPPMPTLFVNAEPRSILLGAQSDFCRPSPNQEEVVQQASGEDTVGQDVYNTGV